MSSSADGGSERGNSTPVSQELSSGVKRALKKTQATATLATGRSPLYRELPALAEVERPADAPLSGPNTRASRRRHAVLSSNRLGRLSVQRSKHVSLPTRFRQIAERRP